MTTPEPATHVLWACIIACVTVGVVLGLIVAGAVGVLT